MIYVNITANRITCKMKTGYFLEILTSETMQLLGSTKVYYNFVNNDYQQDSRFSYTFVTNKSLSQLLDISPKNF